MKIVHVLTDSNIGGAGILLESLLRHTGLPKEEILVILPRGAALAPRYAALGVRVEAILRGGDRSLAPRDLLRLVALLRRERPDILHAHAALTAKLAARLAGVPHVLGTRHCAYPVKGILRWFRQPLFRFFDRLLCDGTVATAEAARDNLLALGLPEERIFLIRNGAEALAPLSPTARQNGRASLGIGREDFVVGMVARLHPVKGHDTLLRAASILLSEHTGWHFLIVGGGEEEERLRAAADRAPLTGHVTLTGFTPQVGAYLGLCDVAVNCSRGTETSCLALSEAMSLGLPCVASRFGGNPEMVREGENGLLFPVGDAEALADRLRTLRLDRRLYAQLSEGARRRFQTDLRAEVMAAAYDRLWRDTVAAGWRKATAPRKPLRGG